MLNIDNNFFFCNLDIVAILYTWQNNQAKKKNVFELKVSNNCLF